MSIFDHSYRHDSLALTHQRDRERPISGSSGQLTLASTLQSSSLLSPRTPRSSSPSQAVRTVSHLEDNWLLSVSERYTTPKTDLHRDADDDTPRLEIEESEKRVRRMKSIERTRTWAEEVERQRQKTEKRTVTRRREFSWQLQPDIQDDSFELDQGMAALGLKTSKLDLPTASSVIEAHQRRYGARLDVTEGHVSSSEGDSEINPPPRPRRRRHSSQSKSGKSSPRPTSRPQSDYQVASSSHIKRSSERLVHLNSTPVTVNRPSSQKRSSPRPSAAAASSSPKIPTKTPALSIDEIIRRHSPAVVDAQVAPVVKARMDLGLSPRTSITSKQSVSPRPSLSPGQTPHTAQIPFTTSPKPMPIRSSSSPGAIIAVVPPRTSSRQATPSPQPKPLPSTSESEEEVFHDLEIGQALLDKLERGSLASSGPSNPHRHHHAYTTPPLPPLSPNTLATPRSSTSTPTPTKDDQPHELAVYLRSPHLNRFFTLPRPYPERPLRVSLAEVGDPAGRPVLVFLGLGCVRYLIAMYDDLARALGLRLICIDRWGYGKTDSVPDEKRSMRAWAAVVERVMDELGVDTFQILAHSAGCAYATAVILRMQERVRGKVVMLAPWVSTEIDGGFKWLKWVPNTVIKSATAAEHRLQTYFLGKPPPLTYKPIGFTAPPLPPRLSSQSPRSSSPTIKPSPNTSPNPNTLSKFESHDSKTQSPRTPLVRSLSKVTTKRLSRQGSILGLRSPPSLQRADSTPIRNTPEVDMKRKLVQRANSEVVQKRNSLESSIQAAINIGLPEGFPSLGTNLRLSFPPSSSSSSSSSFCHISPPREEIEKNGMHDRHSTEPQKSNSPSRSQQNQIRQFDHGNDLVRLSQEDHPPIRDLKLNRTSSATRPSEEGEKKKPRLTGAMLVALEQASHAESEPGTTSDLLGVVLARQAWGFSYSDLPSEIPVRIYWGKEDDRVGEKGIRWLERNLNAEVVVLSGEGHGLVSRGGVMFDVLKGLARDDVLVRPVEREF
ncbi:hypothetical protein M231_08066 [Tremella mesenterica]|uniref:AB hydrolase-1 domain-containing protein n=1 Tax=Tremella mesenterica TaxID=5217 RepID=A0A4Q1B7N8_TREME|nr:hypothetical protein M231_08066 [Tremella mesenterica]